MEVVGHGGGGMEEDLGWLHLGGGGGGGIGMGVPEDIFEGEGSKPQHMNSGG